MSAFHTAEVCTVFRIGSPPRPALASAQPLQAGEGQAGSAAIYWTVGALAVGGRAQAFKGVSSGMLPPMGLLFGLLVGFVASQVWTNVDHAQLAVDPEASVKWAGVVIVGVLTLLTTRSCTSPTGSPPPSPWGCSPPRWRPRSC